MGADDVGVDACLAFSLSDLAGFSKACCGFVSAGSPTGLAVADWSTDSGATTVSLSKSISHFFTASRGVIFFAATPITGRLAGFSGCDFSTGVIAGADGAGGVVGDV